MQIFFEYFDQILPALTVRNFFDHPCLFLSGPSESKLYAIFSIVLEHAAPTQALKLPMNRVINKILADLT